MFSAYIFISVILLLFSYTQVDLNLTLSRAGIITTFEKSFQYIGFYQRPLASVLYIVIVFVFFLLNVLMVRKNFLRSKNIWKIIFTISGILLFSYPAAFSYDFFNYMFTAKTILIYHSNPYSVIPLQFAGLDPWINFMRWTHLPSAYGPFWIGLSLIPFIAGLGYFLPVLFLTKLLMIGFYLLSCWAIEKITKKPESLVLFALNPLIILETLVSGHNDIVLVAFALISIYYFNEKKYIATWFYLSASIAAKLMTIFLIPVIILKKNKTWMLVAMITGLILVISQREFLPWYWVWIVPFVALIPEKRNIVLFSTALSFGLILSYAPYFYFGHYNLPVPFWKLILTWMPLCVASIYIALKHIKAYII